MRAWCAVVLVVLMLGGCGGSKQGLRLTLLNASVQKPSNLAVYFTVDTADGEPVAGLTAEQFRIYEDGQPISTLESKQTILNPEVAAEHMTLLLVDMSGSVSESDDVPLIMEAARGFSARVEKYQKVAVYAFDGSREIHRLTGFTTGPELQAGVEKIGAFKTVDPSTNLNGAIVEGIKVLQRELRGSRAPLTFGTLVVFTDGTDRAGRVKAEDVQKSIDEADFDILVIGVGTEIDDDALNKIGRDGTIISKDRSQIASSFEQAAARIEGYSKRYYLLGYCSPARDGEHDLTIETEFDGKHGSVTYHFNARGFRPNCDPTQKPSFSTSRPPSPPPQPDEKEPPSSGGGKF
jgi:hypothetical protein